MDSCAEGSTVSRFLVGRRSILQSNNPLDTTSDKIPCSHVKIGLPMEMQLPVHRVLVRQDAEAKPDGYADRGYLLSKDHWSLHKSVTNHRIDKQDTFDRAQRYEEYRGSGSFLGTPSTEGDGSHTVDCLLKRVDAQLLLWKSRYGSSGFKGAPAEEPLGSCHSPFQSSSLKGAPGSETFPAAAMERIRRLEKQLACCAEERDVERQRALRAEAALRAFLGTRAETPSLSSPNGGISALGNMGASEMRSLLVLGTAKGSDANS